MELFEEAEVDRFRSIIARRLGMQFDGGRTELLSDILRQRLRVRDTSAGAYLACLDSGVNDQKEMRALAALLTVSETYFFRGSDQFRALAEVAIPQRILARGPGKRLRLLSAGCASGEEPYSLAILLRERFPDLRSWDVEILGLDINPAMIAKTREARYHAWSFRDTPHTLRDKYFHAEGDALVLEESVRSMVRFEEMNLCRDDWTGLNQFDIILCRNVMMYLVPEAAHSVVANLTQALVPEGYLFLGYAETLSRLSQAYTLCQTCDAFYYQKRGEKESPPEFPRVRTPANYGAEAARRASERMDSLPQERARLVRARPKAAGGPLVEPGIAVELLRQERFREALDVLGELPRELSDPDVLLLRAGLLTNCGDPAGAEAVCRQILSADHLNPGAHYLTALCRERAGDEGCAWEHDRAAIYLDASFAMPHLHLGRMAKRSADWNTARRELQHAATLLLREEPSRILLFGGGFSREALVAFSRAELRACGGSP